MKESQASVHALHCATGCVESLPSTFYKEDRSEGTSLKQCYTRPFSFALFLKVLMCCVFRNK